MKIKIIRFLTFLCVGVLFLGCLAKINYNAYQPSISTDKHFDKTVQIEVNKVENTIDIDFSDYIYKSTRNAIQKSQLFSKVVQSNSDIKIITHAVNIHSPIFGTKMTTIVEIAWIVLKNHNIIFKKSYITNGSASSKDEAYGPARAVISIQKAIQKNIEQALKEISQLDIK